MNILTQVELVRQIDDFLARHAMKPTRLAREATGEPGLIDAIRDGKRSPTLNTVEKLANYMRAKDAEAATQAKLHAPIAPVAEGEAVDEPLPFGNAPAATRPGASSPTCSSTPARPPSSAAKNSNPCSAGIADAR